MQFGELIENVTKYLLDVPDDTTDLIPVWINQAVEDAERRHNFRHMERTLQVVTTPNVREQADVPVLYKESRSDPFLIRGDSAVSEIDWAPSRSDMIRQYGDDPDIDIGSPQFILEIFDESEDVTEFHSYPFPDTRSLYPDGNYRLNLPYYALSPSMVDGSDSNFITSKSKFYVIYRATHYGMIFNRDEDRAIAYAALAEQHYRILRRVDKKGRVRRRAELTLRLGVNQPSKVPRSSLGFGRRN